MSATANFASTPRSEITSISTANTNRDGTGTIASAFTAGAGGSRVERIEIKATSTTTAGMVRLFKKKGPGSWALWREYPVSAITPSASQETFSTIDDPVEEILDDDIQIGASTHNAENFWVHITGGDN